MVGTMQGNGVGILMKLKVVKTGNCLTVKFIMKKWANQHFKLYDKNIKGKENQHATSFTNLRKAERKLWIRRFSFILSKPVVENGQWLYSPIY